MYLDPEGEIRAGVVFDNLIHRGEMPVTIGVFVDPGQPGNRNAEYDAFDDIYAAFLLREILPAVQDGHLITDDPDRWRPCDCLDVLPWREPRGVRRRTRVR